MRCTDSNKQTFSNGMRRYHFLHEMTEVAKDIINCVPFFILNALWQD
jgi:hypothetical protein